MTGVYCFSATGRSREVANWFGEALGIPVKTMDHVGPEETAVVVFPVYCQNIPQPVREFLPRLKAENVVLIAAYGRMSYGNVLWEAAQLVSGRVIAGAYVPIGHTYLEETADFDPEPIEPILDRLRNPRPCQIRRTVKNPVSDISPLLRSQLGVRLKRNGNCNGCGICEAACPVRAMKAGVPGKNCIRCLGCVSACPSCGMEWRLSFFVSLYLRKNKRTETVLFL